jgi:hypothetical protein
MEAVFDLTHTGTISLPDYVEDGMATMTNEDNSAPHTQTP